MLKPIIKPLTKPIQKLATTFRRQTLLERRAKQMEELIKIRQAKGLPTKAEELHKTNIEKEAASLKDSAGGKISEIKKKINE
jgi:hypothetical protein